MRQTPSPRNTACKKPRGEADLLHNGCLELVKEHVVATYLELKEQGERLLAQAEEMREKEIADAIADIKEKMRLYGLTAEDLGLARATGGKSQRGKAAPAAIKYRGPNGETWSGGRGRKPQWVTQALQAGHKLEDFAVKGAAR
jgi:DNA-binding protein H-NS